MNKDKHGQIIWICLSIWTLGALWRSFDLMILSGPSRLKKMQSIAVKHYKVLEKEKTQEPWNFSLEKCSSLTCSAKEWDNLLQNPQIKLQHDLNLVRQDISTMTALQIWKKRTPFFRIKVQPNFIIFNKQEEIIVMCDRFGFWLPQTYQQKLLRNNFLGEKASE